uniref:Uncharacterized protein n=1 Tax=Arundo donax TaxID=35708 RepID=A0A0A9H7Z7_ARUDO
MVPDHKMSASGLANWFKAFYYGFTRERVVWYPYEDISDFELPFKFRPDAALADETSA